MDLELRGNSLIIGVHNNVCYEEDFEGESRGSLTMQQLLFDMRPNLEKKMKAE